ncbi:MAG: PHP domain-containing protein [Deltaproteobacteria bacterium]|nr:MAG: PHP domain-containing protein [Deltaproteobacteria bacterium]
MLIDLHVQSHYSRKGKLDPDDIVRRAKDIGLNGICLTEDQPIDKHDELQALAKDHDFPVFVGRTVFTEKGHLLFIPRDTEHVTKHGVFPHNVDDDTPLAYDKVAERAQELGGVLVAAHPYKLQINHPMGDRLFDMEGLTAIEVRNGSCKSLVNDFALEATFHLKLPGVAGSQTCESLNELGTAASLFCQELESQEDLVDAIQAGQVWPAQLQDTVEFRKSSSSRDDRGGRDDRRGGGRGGDRRGGGGGGRGGRGGDRRGRR